MAEKHAPDFDAIDRRLALGDGGSAFPLRFDQVVSPGMSLRDHFAAQALVGAMAHYAGTPQEIDSSYIARLCYKHADQMLEARK